MWFSVVVIFKPMLSSIELSVAVFVFVQGCSLGGSIVYEVMRMGHCGGVFFGTLLAQRLATKNLLCLLGRLIQFWTI